MENYKNVSQDIRDQLNAEAEAIQIILIGIDNDIYSTVDACPNACEISQQSTRNRGKSHVTPSAPTYDPELVTVTEDEEMLKDNEIDKLMALNFSSHNSPRINRGTGYDNQRVVNVAGARENVGTPVVQKSGIQCYNCKEYGHKFLGTVKFRNDQIAPILGYGDLVQGTITIKRVYYVEGLNHNLFSVGQSCDADLEVAFRKSTCYIRDLKGNDLLTGSRGIRFSIPFVA
ncbi:hypothetical protein Tco_0714160 [Tanacetum coccineum]